MTACTGLRCGRPECQARRKERLLRSWQERKARRPVTAMNKSMERFMNRGQRGWGPPSVTIQDDRWRMEAEARVRARTAPVRHGHEPTDLEIAFTYMLENMR